MANTELCNAVVEASRNLEVNRAAFLQATIFLLRAESAALLNVEDAAPTHSGFLSSLHALEDFTAPLGMSAGQYLECNLFLTQISGLEFFLQRCVVAVIKAYPKKIGTAQFTLSQVLDAETKEALVENAAESYLNKLMYKKPGEYLDDLCKLLSIDPSHLKDEWPHFVEAKARRDVGVHNNWICNEIYLRKIAEVGLTSAFEIGDSVVPDDPEYFEVTIGVFGDIATAISANILRNYGNYEVEEIKELLNPNLFGLLRQNRT